MTEAVQTKLEAGVLTLTLARAEKKNALTDAMYAALADALEAAKPDPAVRCVVFEALGDSFCAGNDIADFARIALLGAAGEAHVFRFLKALAASTTPMIAAVQGAAVGVGTTLLLHCDLVFVADDVSLSTPFANLGLTPEAASSGLLPARIGHVRAFSMFALGEKLDAATAVAWGLANAAVPRAELSARAAAAAAAVAARPPIALKQTKDLMRQGEAIAALMDVEAALFIERLKSDEAREAFMAFAARKS
jgi:enoyl-CoA hydratase/carnithine racemase